MGDTISALTRRAKETASQNTLRCGSKDDSSKRLGRSVMSRCGIRQQIRFVLILFSLWQYVETYFAEPDTTLSVYKSFMKNLEEEPALQCRRQFARRTRHH